jgi:DNA-binding GntR family transcriptional regulator
MTGKAKSKVASQRVADILAERILSGELRPGERIKQDELAEELDISRIPVRDALRILETRGLVALKANAGARVTQLTIKDMDLSYRIREMLEPMLLAESIPNLTDADIEEMAAVKTKLDRIEDLDDYLPLSREFHWLAFSGHDAPLLAQIVERLWDTTQSYRLAYARLSLQEPERMATMRAERGLLFDAIAARDVDLAPGLLATHIRRTHVGLLKFAHLHELLGS